MGVGGNGVPSGPRTARARAAFVAGVLLLLAVSWWPFRLDVPRLLETGVEVRSDGSLRFVDEAFASTAGSPDWLATALDEGHLEVALRVRSDDPHQTGPARVLALSAPPRGASRDVLEHDLVIGQDGPDLIARVVRPGTSGQGTPPLIATGVFAEPAWRDVELVLGDAVTLMVDGRARAHETDTTGWAELWDDRHELSLGNTLSGQRPWAGTIARATVVAGGEAVDVLASPELEIQERARRLPARLTGEVSRPPPQRALVGGLHVLLGAFIGAALVAAWPERPLRVHLGVLVGLALVANVGKVFVAGRHPSVATALLQAGGSGLGAAALYEGVQTRRARAS